MMYRRFGWVQSRLLLQKQTELQEMEKALEKLDEQEDDDPGESKKLMRAYNPRGEGNRKTLMTAMEAKFLEYGML